MPRSRAVVDTTGNKNSGAGYGYVYETKNLVNGKMYIGLHSGQLDTTYLGSGVRLKPAIKKYGSVNFLVTLLVYAWTIEELNLLEKEFIKKYREKFGSGMLYNISDGGYQDGLQGTRVPEIVRKKISKNNARNQLGKPLPEDVRMKIGNALRNRKLSPETRAKMSASRTGKPHPMPPGYVPWNKGLPVPPEMRKRISEALKGRPTGRKGIKFSKAHCQAISLGKKKWWALYKKQDQPD